MTLIALVVQVRTRLPVLFVMPAVGVVSSFVMVMLEVDEQPLADVTVTV